MKKICAVIVTFNRAELLCRCIEKLLNQDYPLDIFIYDNHSTQDTKGALESRNLLKENVTYYYAESNTGGSGGFNNGMNMAMQKGYDALWLMDDDGYAVYPDTLSKVVEAWEKIDNADCMLNSLVVSDPETLNLSFSLDRTFDGNEICKRAEKGLLKDLASPFNGTFVTAGVIKKLGYPIKEFFVYGDETEYFLRIKTNNFPVYTVVNSIYYHPTLTRRVKNFFGRKISFSEIPLWKTYCASRNTMYFCKKYYDKKTIFKKKIRLYIECLFVEKNKWEKFKITKQGIKDGLKGDLTKQIDLSK